MKFQKQPLNYTRKLHFDYIFICRSPVDKTTTSLTALTWYRPRRLSLEEKFQSSPLKCLFNAAVKNPWHSCDWGPFCPMNNAFFHIYVMGETTFSNSVTIHHGAHPLKPQPRPRWQFSKHNDWINITNRDNQRKTIRWKSLSWYELHTIALRNLTWGTTKEMRNFFCMWT